MCGHALAMQDRNDAIVLVISAKYETAMDYLGAQKYMNALIESCLNETDRIILEEGKDLLNARGKSASQIEMKKKRNNVSMNL